MCHKAPIQTVSRADGFSNIVKKKKKFKTVTIVSQNVRGVKSDERIEELCMSMKKHDTFVACIQETWRSDDELFKNDDFLFIGTGLKKNENSRRGSQGVGIILSSTAQTAWIAAGSEIYNSFGSRIIAVRLQVKGNQNREIYLFIV